MMTPAAFQEMANDVARLNNLPVTLASRIVAVVGDTPETDEQDRVLATVDGVEYRVIWPAIEDEEES